MDAVTPSSWSYTEYGKLASQVKDNAEGLADAAKHFESLFINMWLKSAREANAAIAKDGVFSSNEMEMQQQMFDSQMAMHLSKEGGIGLAPVIMRQLSGQVGSAATAPPTVEEPTVAAPSSSPIERATFKPTAQLQTAVPSISEAADIQAHPAPGRRRSLFDDMASFVNTMAPKIKGVVGAAGLPPLAVMAQAALETGWGQSVIEDQSGRSSHNLFGLKAQDWSGPEVQIHSKEFLLGQWQDKLDGFRAYPDWDAGIADYVQSITSSPRYANAVTEQLGAKDYAEFLQQSGYATDPNYAQKLKSIMHRLNSMGF